jgi:hypothetical protein
MRLFLIFLCLPVFAACRSNTFGSVTQTQCDDGSSYNSFEMNKQTIINGTDAEGRDTSGMFEGEQQLSQFASVIAGTLGVSGKANPLPKRACIG